MCGNPLLTCHLGFPQQTNEKGQVVTKTALLKQMEELIEEPGLTCCICREGYKFQVPAWAWWRGLLPPCAGGPRLRALLFQEWLRLASWPLFFTGRNISLPCHRDISHSLGPISPRPCARALHQLHGFVFKPVKSPSLWMREQRSWHRARALGFQK